MHFFCNFILNREQRASFCRKNYDWVLCLVFTVLAIANGKLQTFSTFYCLQFFGPKHYYYLSLQLAQGYISNVPPCSYSVISFVFATPLQLCSFNGLLIKTLQENRGIICKSKKRSKNITRNSSKVLTTAIKTGSLFRNECRAKMTCVEVCQKKSKRVLPWVTVSPISLQKNKKGLPCSTKLAWNLGFLTFGMGLTRQLDAYLFLFVFTWVKVDGGWRKAAIFLFCGFFCNRKRDQGMLFYFGLHELDFLPK